MELWIKHELSDNGVSDVYSPRNIIMGRYITYDKHFKFRLGSYVESHEDPKINNDIEEKTFGGILLGTTSNVQESQKIFSLKTGSMVTSKQNIADIPMITWFTRRIEALAACGVRDLEDCNTPLWIDFLENKNDFAAALHEGSIAGVAQGDQQDDDGSNGNTDKIQESVDTNPEDPYEPPGIALDPAAVHRKLSGVIPTVHPVELTGLAPLEKPAELPGVALTENEVDGNIMPTLLPSDYGRDNEPDEKEADMSTQHRLWVIHPEAMLPMVRNIYNIRPRKQNDYVKENNDRSMSFAQVGNDLNKDVL